MAVYGIQQRMMELGRVRLGDEKTDPRKPGRPRSTFRFTSASRRLLEHVATTFGGEVQPWEAAPKGEGYWQVSTDASELNIVLPPTFSEKDGSPTTSYSQHYELWTKGGCQRRCDGITEALSGKPCLCDPERRKAGEDSECKVHTRVSFMLPEIPGLGLWRLETSGYWAAVELPGTLDVLARAAAQMEFVRAVLRIEHRRDVKAGQTRKYIVPVIELPDVTIGQLVSGDVPTLTLNTPAVRARVKPELPSAPAPPTDNGFDNAQPTFGERPALPTLTESDQDARHSAHPGETVAVPGSVSARDRSTLTQPQTKKLNTLVGKLRDPGHISTADLYRAVADMRQLDPAQIRDDVDGRDKDGLHWGPLRDSLNRDEAHMLIDRLEALEAKVAEEPSQFRIPESAR